MRRPIPDQQASSPRQSLHLSRACVAASRSARCTIGKGASAGSCDRPLAAVDPEGDPDSDAGASTHPGDNVTSQRGEAPGSRILPPIESIVIRRSELTDNHETPARTRIATTSCVHRSHGGRCSQHSRHTLTSVAQLPQEPTRRAAGFDNGFIKISPHTLVSVDTIVQ